MAQSVAPPTAHDLADIYVNGGIPLNQQNNNTPDQLLHGGEHFDDVPPRHARRGDEARLGVLPRDLLHDIIMEKDLKRNAPASWRSN